MSQESKMLTPMYVTTPGGYGQEHGCWDRAEFEEGKTSIQFQNGPVAVHGANGVTDADVLKVVVDHVRALQKVEGSRERAMVITKLDEALLWERARAEKDNTREKAVERAAGRVG